MVTKQVQIRVMKRILSALVVAGMTLCSCTGTPSAPEPIRSNELEAFADQFFAERMEQLHIPGLVFVAVQDGKTILAKGYGKASIQEDRDVQPEASVFRIGSVSKVFVAAAVLQLVEQGRLELDADVNGYLQALQVDNRFGTPLTLEHLLTHTGGIQDPPYESHTDPSARQPLAQFLAHDLLPIATAPGDEFRYSSNGYALAAYVVEEVSGLPFDQYVEEHILQPLGMRSTTYLLTPQVPAEMATGSATGNAAGYAYRDGSLAAQPLDYDDDYPAGALTSTGSDMANFMTAMLGDGCYGGTCILEAATVTDMQRARVRVGSGSPRQTLGFVEGEIEGVRVVGHTGAIRGFGSTLDMFPAHRAGYFFAFNAECLESSACDIIPEFRRAFVERFLRK